MKPIKVTTQSLDDVLDALGWRTCPSVVEGHRRLYNESGLLVNVADEWGTWMILKREGLIEFESHNPAYESLVREVGTAIAFKGGRR